MKCEDILKALDLYLEGDEANAACVAFREHLTGCERCRLVVDNIKNTVTLYQDDIEQSVMPEDCQKRLQKFLQKKWRETKL